MLKFLVYFFVLVVSLKGIRIGPEQGLTNSVISGQSEIELLAGRYNVGETLFITSGINLFSTAPKGSVILVGQDGLTTIKCVSTSCNITNIAIENSGRAIEFIGSTFSVVDLTIRNCTSPFTSGIIALSSIGSIRGITMTNLVGTTGVALRLADSEMSVDDLELSLSTSLNEGFFILVRSKFTMINSLVRNNTGQTLLFADHTTTNLQTDVTYRENFLPYVGVLHYLKNRRTEYTNVRFLNNRLGDTDAFSRFNLHSLLTCVIHWGSGHYSYNSCDFIGNDFAGIASTGQRDTLPIDPCFIRGCTFRNNRLFDIYIGLQTQFVAHFIEDNLFDGCFGVSSFVAVNLLVPIIFINNCKFINTFTVFGGVYASADAQSSAISIKNSLFDGNIGIQGTGRPGSALTLFGSVAEIDNVTFVNNIGNLGGGIHVQALGSTVLKINMTNLVFENNTSLTNGGGIFTSLNSTIDQLTLVNSTFRNNVAALAGGAAFFSRNGNDLTAFGQCSDCSGNTADYGNDYATDKAKIVWLEPSSGVSATPLEPVKFTIISQDDFENTVSGNTIDGIPLEITTSRNGIFNTPTVYVFDNSGSVSDTLQFVGDIGSLYDISVNSDGLTSTFGLTVEDCPGQYTLPYSLDASMVVCVNENIKNDESSYEAVQIVISVIVGILYALTVLFAILAIVQFKANVVYIGLVSLSSTLLTIAVFLFIPNPTDGLCISILWLLGIGGSIAIGLPTGRIISVILDLPYTLVFAVTGAYVLIEIIFLIIWTSVDSVGEDFYQDNIDITLYCNKTDQAFYIVQICLIGIGLLIAIILTAITSIKSKYYQKSYISSMIVYIVTLIVAVGIPLMIVLDLDQLIARYVITCICIALVSFLPTFLMYCLPKIEQFTESLSFSSAGGASTFSSTISSEFKSVTSD